MNRTHDYGRRDTARQSMLAWIRLEHETPSKMSTICLDSSIKTSTKLWATLDTGQLRNPQTKGKTTQPHYQVRAIVRRKRQ